MLQSLGCIVPSSSFMPSNKECSGNLLDLQTRLIQLCPHRETLASLLTVHGKMPVSLPPRCLICEDVSVSKKTRLGGKACRPRARQSLSCSSTDPLWPQLPPTGFSKAPRERSFGLQGLGGLGLCKERIDVLLQSLQLLIQSLH